MVESHKHFGEDTGGDTLSGARRPPEIHGCIKMYKIALAQMNIHVGQPDTNLAQAQALAAQAQAGGADLLLLPELWLHGYDLERAHEWASPLGQGGFGHMSALARRAGIFLAGSTMERHAGGVSNTLAVYAPDGALVASYRKIHLFRLMQEDRYLVPGDHATLCDTPWGPTGLAICYDLRFPELFRTLSLAGATLFLLPAQWPVPRLEAWLVLARARAVENELFVAACNRVGKDGDVTFPGHSLVVDPLGNTLVEGDDQERLLIAEIDMREVRRTRRYLPVFQDRRPEAYRLE